MLVSERVQERAAWIVFEKEALRDEGSRKPGLMEFYCMILCAICLGRVSGREGASLGS
jgi:hypothetical protein